MRAINNFIKNKFTKDREWKKVVATSICGAVVAMACGPANAYRFQFDDPEIVAFIDTTFKASAAMRTQGPHQPGGQPTGKWTVFGGAGDIYSTPVSALIDAGISKGNIGFFTRLSYIYDYKINDKDCTNCNRPTSQLAFGDPSPDGIHSSAQNTAGDKFRLLDFFVYGGWDIGDHPLNVRVGKQVVNWGESSIQGGGISQMQNPTDLAKRTTPGTEVKETLMPQETAYFNVGVTDNVEVEAYYTWNWRDSIFMPVGTFYSPFDLIGSGYNPDIIPGVLKKGEDEPDGGQWGAAVHFILDSFNAAELALFYVRSHAHSAHIGLNPNYVPGPDPDIPGADTLGAYQWVYPEDQDTYAISLSGESILNTAFALELNYKESFYDTRQCQNYHGIGSFLGLTDNGTGTTGDIDGCETGASDVYTLLGNFSKSGGTTFLNADKMSMLLDYSLVWQRGLDHGDPTDRENTGRVDKGRYPGVDMLDRPLTDFAWGYTAVVGLEYNDVFANINVLPTLIFAHGVEGYTAFTGGALVENARTMVYKLGFTYLTRTQVDLQFVDFIGSATTSDDTDNVSIVFKYSF